LSTPDVSVVIPVYNEEAGLAQLFARLYPALDALGRSYEIVFIDDGSQDRSVALLREQFNLRPDVTRVVIFAGNFGQHNAILAGFAQVRGNHVVTLDADLQNPPEEITNLVAQLEFGHDYVGTVRQMRQDSIFRRWPSRLLNAMRERTTNIHITDQGCMLRGYARGVVDAVNHCPEVNTFIPALAYLFARNPVEIPVKHEERAAGTSKYSMYKLLRLNFDLMTGFSIVPLQIYSLLGLLVAGGSLALFVYIMVQRILYGPDDTRGVFTLFSITFFILGVLLVGVGLLGEYIGRIYTQVRGRPRYLLQAILEHGVERTLGTDRRRSDAPRDRDASGNLLMSNTETHDG
jgi:undecaprenyl-phosphate 4-deoxy-4-formamido-L-arabinose transferase